MVGDEQGAARQWLSNPAHVHAEDGAKAARPQADGAVVQAFTARRKAGAQGIDQQQGERQRDQQVQQQQRHAQQIA